jgi:hypothetical protein
MSVLWICVKLVRICKSSRFQSVTCIFFVQRQLSDIQTENRSSTILKPNYFFIPPKFAFSKIRLSLQTFLVTLPSENNS